MTARDTANVPKKADSRAMRRSRARAASTEAASGWTLNVTSRLTAVNAVATLRATELDSERERTLMQMLVSAGRPSPVDCVSGRYIMGGGVSRKDRPKTV